MAAPREIKLCLLGDAGVGKSSLVVRFVSDKFAENLESTIGASFMSKTVLVDNKTFKYQIWDTAGQEKYRGLAPMYYRGAAVAILVYDITNRQSFVTLKDWVTELKHKAPSDIVLAVVGNKCDLAPQRAIPAAEAVMYAESIGAVFFETSARSALNVLPLFEGISALELQLRYDVVESGQLLTHAAGRKLPQEAARGGGGAASRASTVDLGGGGAGGGAAAKKKSFCVVL